MTHDHDTVSRPERRGRGLAVRLMWAVALASLLFLLAGVAGWRLLQSARQEIGPDAQGSLLACVDGISLGLAVGVVFAVAVLACLYFYLVRTVVRPMQTNARLMDRLAAGDEGDDVPDSHLARDDEIGDMARAVRALTARQQEEARIAADMSAGNFTSVMTAPDALGQPFRQMLGVVTETLARANAHLGLVMAGCKAIASASRDVADNNVGIAGAVTDISADLDHIRKQAEDNMDAATQAGQLAGTGSQSIEHGYESVGEMGAVMLNMQACGDKIVGIAKSIGDIAFQTNLLALNASVEAARAGKHGKGFTIVAEEVRRLASRTSKAAEETSTLMQETVEQVELAAAIAGRINATFSEMQDNIREADALLAKIGTSSREQSGDAEKISAVLHRMEYLARENARCVDNAMGMAGNMLRQTGQLGQMMSRFSLNNGRPSESDSSAGFASGAPDLLPVHANRPIDLKSSV